MNIIFSLAKDTDREQLLQLLSDRQDEANQLRGETGNTIKDRGGDYFDKVISDENILLVLGKNGDKIIATTTIYLLPRIRKTSYFAIIEDVLVAKDYRGQGIGTLLMEYIIELCKKNSKIRKIKLGSLLESEKAHLFYEKLGFEAKEKLFSLKLK